MEQKIQELWNNYKYNENTRRRRKKGTKEIFEVILAKNFLK